MPKRINREIERLKKMVLAKGGLVRENLRMAMRSLLERDPGLAEKVISDHEMIDGMGMGLEEECIKILAFCQPVAIDLRLVISVLKIGKNLERIGDLVVKIADDSKFLIGQEKIEADLDFEALYKQVQTMFRNCLDALVNMDAPLAFTVCADNCKVGGVSRHICDQAKEYVKKHPDQVPIMIRVTGISRGLERIADHAADIATHIQQAASVSDMRLRRLFLQGAANRLAVGKKPKKRQINNSKTTQQDGLDNRGEKCPNDCKGKSKD